MNKQKWVYWGLTAPIMAMMTLGGVGMLMGGEQNLQGLTHLGYPHYFRFILGPAKLLGVFAIVFGRFPTLKEWAYAGFTFNMIAAAMSHGFSGDPLWQVVTPFVMLAMHITCYRMWKKGPAQVTSGRTAMAA